MTTDELIIQRLNEIFANQTQIISGQMRLERAMAELAKAQKGTDELIVKDHRQAVGGRWPENYEGK